MKRSLKTAAFISFTGLLGIFHTVKRLQQQARVFALTAALSLTAGQERPKKGTKAQCITQEDKHSEGGIGGMFVLREIGTKIAERSDKNKAARRTGFPLKP